MDEIYSILYESNSGSTSQVRASNGRLNKVNNCFHKERFEEDIYFLSVKTRMLLVRVNMLLVSTRDIYLFRYFSLSVRISVRLSLDSGSGSGSSNSSTGLRNQDVSVSSG